MFFSMNPVQSLAHKLTKTSMALLTLAVGTVNGLSANNATNSTLNANPGSESAIPLAFIFSASMAVAGCLACFFICIEDCGDEVTACLDDCNNGADDVGGYVPVMV